MNIYINKIIIFFLTFCLLLPGTGITEENQNKKYNMLSPVSAFLNKTSQIDARMAGISTQIIQNVISFNTSNPSNQIYSIKDLFNKILQKNKNQIISDLNRLEISVLFYRERIDFVGKDFTLTLSDHITTETNESYQIPGTRISVFLKKNLLSLPEYSPLRQLKAMLKSASSLEEHINSKAIYTLIPEWQTFEPIGENKHYRKYHHMPPNQHILLAFNKFETQYFKDIFKKHKVSEEEILDIKIALLLHDIGIAEILKEHPDYPYTEYVKHPIYSVESAKKLIDTLQSPFTNYEERLILFLIKYHSILADFARYGESHIATPEEFLQEIRGFGKRGLLLLHILQLLDASSVRHKTDNSLSLGLEQRIENVTKLFENILKRKRVHETKTKIPLLRYLKNIKQQNNDIKKAFRKLKLILEEKQIIIDHDILEKAFQTMHKSHLGALRKDGKTPYVIHCIESAQILVEELGERDPVCIIAALLHDVLEDTRTTPGALGENFGMETMQIVQLLSKPSKELYSDKEERDRDYFHRTIYGTKTIKDRKTLTKVQKIKIADRINNLRTLDTTDPDFPKKTINHTYLTFIPYFVGSTEVEVHAKQKLIEELIKANHNRGILSEFQIQQLHILSDKILKFEVQDIETGNEPFGFIEGIINSWHTKNPNKPPVLAFDGMSGVGRSDFTETLKTHLESTGKHVVVFDATDFLISRKERDNIVAKAKEKGENYQEQRENLFRFQKFEQEVLQRLMKFRDSGEEEIRIYLTNLYDRYSQEGENLQAKKEYVIKRNTIIIIEGMHTLQENFLKYYDATFLLYDTAKHCEENVINRERQKPAHLRQSNKKIYARFNYVDWPSYRRHFMEYWLNSGFIIDKTKTGNPKLKRNFFARASEKILNAPASSPDTKPYTENMLKQIYEIMKSFNVNINTIINNSKSATELFINLLATDEAETIIKDFTGEEIPIPSPDIPTEALYAFLQKLEEKITKNQLADLFFKLTCAYILEEQGELTIAAKVKNISLYNAKDRNYLRTIFKQAKRKRHKSKTPFDGKSYKLTFNAKDLQDPAKHKELKTKIKRLALSLTENNFIEIKLHFGQVNPEEAKTLFHIFYDSLKIGTRKTKKKKLKVDFIYPPESKLNLPADKIIDEILKLNKVLADILELEKSENQEDIKKAIADKLENILSRKNNSPASKILAWHVLLRLNEASEKAGTIMYSLENILESGVSPAQLQYMLHGQNGKMYLYGGDEYSLSEEFTFLRKEGFIVNTSQLKDLQKKQGIIIYMLNIKDIQNLTLTQIPVGRLAENAVILPIAGIRNIEKDFTLANEILRVEGRTEELISIFKQMLRKMIFDYFLAKGEQLTDKELEHIADNEPTAEEVDTSYEEIKRIIVSA
jgi:uridine kinase